MKVITALDIAKKDGCKNVLDWIRRVAAAKKVKPSFVVNADPGSEVVARVDHGRWIADCPDCNGAEYVDPDEPVFFCFGCLNTQYQGQLRPVRFPPPEIRERIEANLRPEAYNSWSEEEEPYGV